MTDPDLDFFNAKPGKDCLMVVAVSLALTACGVVSLWLAVAAGWR